MTAFDDKMCNGGVSPGQVRFEKHCFRGQYCHKTSMWKKKFHSQEKSYWSWWYVICVLSGLPLARSGWYHLVTPSEPAKDLHSQSLEPFEDEKNNLYIKHIFTLNYYMQHNICVLMWSYLVSHDSYSSVVLVVVCDDSRQPLSFGLLSEHFHFKAL